LSGNKKFHINHLIYDVEINNLFFINAWEWHCFSHFDENEEHERFLLFIYPDYLKASSTARTDLSACFPQAATDPMHSIILTEEERRHFVCYIESLSPSDEYGSDLFGHASFLKLMVFLNRIL